MRAFTQILACIGSAMLLGCQEQPTAKPNVGETDTFNSEKRMTDRKRLIAKIDAQSSPGKLREIVVSLEDFFVGNNDPGSIGVNLGQDQPPIVEFHRVLSEIRAKPNVQDVLVRIYDYDDPTSWPYTDTVYIISSAPLATVQEWVNPLLPDEVHAEWMYGKPPAAPEIQSGMTPYSVWWD
ncbi:MAG: hypothetical protein WEB58_23240 [Planctomycetaceae bacterium]